jgi:hypothetical protein
LCWKEEQQRVPDQNFAATARIVVSERGRLCMKSFNSPPFSFALEAFFLLHVD